MKKLIFTLVAAASLVLLLSHSKHSSNLFAGFVTGTPEIKSINALAFGPQGVLFIGDSKSASIFAIDSKDAVQVDNAAQITVKNIDQKIGAFLGTDVKNISIQDLKVNPLSKKIYCAVQSSDGTPVLLNIDAEKIQAVSLKNVSYSQIQINNPVSEEAKDRGGRPMRVWAISDMKYSDGKVFISGLSNQEFGSTFRSIPFPFNNVQDQSSLEIYHAAHGRFETAAPIRTFTTAELNGKKFLIASYTCTPLVLFPLDDLKLGLHVKGRTVGEFGAGNSPIDMITMKKGGDLFLIMANSDRPVMKIKYSDIESYQGSLTTQVKEIFSTAGVPYISYPLVNVVQLDKLDENRFVFIQRKSNGDLDLDSKTVNVYD
jgi:hypothetical protein